MMKILDLKSSSTPPVLSCSLNVQTGSPRRQVECNPAASAPLKSCSTANGVNNLYYRKPDLAALSSTININQPREQDQTCGNNTETYPYNRVHCQY